MANDPYALDALADGEVVEVEAKMDKSAEGAAAPPADAVDTEIHSTEALDQLLKNDGGGQDDAPPAPAAVADKPAEVVPPQPDKEKDAAAAVDKPAAEAAAADPFEKVELPPNTKPKTGEAFEQVKKLARESLQQREKIIAEQTAELAKLREESKTRLPAEAEKELNELRQLRKSVDVESDPIFAEKFDSKISVNTDLIYKKLGEAGASAEQIEQIKKLGGPANVDWDPILNRLPSNVKRFVESKLNENDSLSEEKLLAVADAKKNADKFLSEREKRKSEQTADDAKLMTETVNEFLPRLPFANLREVPANAKPEEKAAIEKHNTEAKAAQAQIQEFLADSSPQNRAAMAVTAVLAFRYKSELAVATAKASDAEKKLADTTAELEKIRKASQTSRARISAPSGKQGIPSFNFGDSGSALDALRANIEAGKE